MSSISTTSPLSDDEYAELDTLLAAPELAGAAMDVSMLEGLLTAVALSPRQIEAAQWLAWMWDKSAGNTLPAASGATERAAALAQRHLAYMIEWLTKDPDSFEPIYECGPEWSVPGWCAGFLQGTQLDKPQWATLAVSHPEYLAPFRHLATTTDLDDDTAEDAQDAVIPSVIAINAAWARQRHLQQSHASDTVLRAVPKTGRNDPCHCGSGKNTRNAAPTLTAQPAKRPPLRQLLSAIVHFLLRHALQFILFVVILLAGRWFMQEWRAYSADSASLAVLQQAASSADAHGLRLADAATMRIKKLGQASQAAIAQRIGEVETRLRQLRSTGQPSLFSWPLPDADQLAQHAGNEAVRSVEIEVLQQESRYLQSLLSALQGEDARTALARLHQVHVAAYAALQANLRQQRQLEAEHPLAVHLPGQAAYGRMMALKRQEAQLRTANLQAYQLYQTQRARTTAAARPAPFAPDQPALDAALAPLQAAIAQSSAQQAGNWIARLRGPVSEVAPTAALLVLSAILLPIAIKAFYFFVIAPLAGRFKPLQIAPGFQQAGQYFSLPPDGLSRISAVSQQLQLDPGQEMLIHPDYLQSSPVSTHKRTQWLLDWRYPFTSLAAGMTALTKLHGSERAAITISASTDPLQEVAVLHLPPGSAIVFQPRGLVGLIQQQGQPVAMSSHWRLASLHAWLTLQLRFIVFRGPATLLVHGCRGVRMECAGTDRAISQAATLGFSTDVLYATTRSETFVPYLRGQQALFNDRFDGDGIFLYEETPRQGKQPGRAGRWFEGAADAVLKVFGI